MALLASGCGDDGETPEGSAGTRGDEAGSGGAGAAGGGMSGGGAGGSGSGGEAGKAGAAGGAAPSGDLYGNFNVTINPAIEETMSAANTTIVGSVYDGPTPNPAVWVERTKASGCTLLVPMPVFCSPSCGSSAQCVGDGMCQSYPKSVSVGTAMVTGVGASTISMDKIVDTYQPKAGTTIPHPPCSEGSMVALEADGLDLTTACIKPLDFPGNVPLEKGKPVKLMWGAPGSGATSKIALKMDISHHGGSKGKIECEVADTGSLEMPMALTDALLDLGTAGYPTVMLTRKSSVSGSGKTANVALNVVSPVERPIVIPGLTSCADNSECPDGQSCLADRKCG